MAYTAWVSAPGIQSYTRDSTSLGSHQAENLSHRINDSLCRKSREIIKAGEGMTRRQGVGLWPWTCEGTQPCLGIFLMSQRQWLSLAGVSLLSQSSLFTKNPKSMLGYSWWMCVGTNITSCASRISNSRTETGGEMASLTRSWHSISHIIGFYSTFPRFLSNTFPY